MSNAAPAKAAPAVVRSGADCRHLTILVGIVMLFNVSLSAAFLEIPS
jgi:hypothetical protein